MTVSLALAAGTLPFLNEIVALLIVSVAIAYVSYRLSLEPIVGFLIAGVVIGPHALGLVSEEELVSTLAEIGVILLLFTIGTEFSLSKLARMSKEIFVGGGLQVLVTALVVLAIAMAFGQSWQTGFYTGCLVALSSTAIVLGMLSERKETGTPTGRLSVGFLIFQDLAIVLMVLLVPMLSGSGFSVIGLLSVLGRAALLVAIVIVLARRAVPWIVDLIARTRRQELFLISVIAICFGTAALSNLMGVSLALGAFLAGLVLSESRYREQALGEILPLRIVFSAVFFVSVGMLLDVGFFIRNPLLILAIAGAVIVLKAIIAGVGVVLLRYPVAIAAGVGVTLSQIGEFSFVLEKAGREAGLTPAGMGYEGTQIFMAVSVILMILTPLMVGAGPWIQNKIAEGDLKSSPQGESEKPQAVGLSDHVVVVGCGTSGRRLVQVLGDTEIPFVVIELDPTTTQELARHEIPHVLGDASRRFILEKAAIERAKMCVVTHGEHAATLHTVRLSRHLNPTVQIIARTRLIDEVERLEQIGADIVIPEELETTVRIFSHVLGAYMVAPAEIDRLTRALRADDYRHLRGSIHEAHLMVLQGLDEEGLHTRAVAVREGAPAAHRTLSDLGMRQNFGISVLAVRRNNETRGNPDGTFELLPGDRLVLIGEAEKFEAAAYLFRPKTADKDASPAR